MNKECNKIDLATPVSVIQLGKKSNYNHIMKSLTDRGIQTIRDLCQWEEQKLLWLSDIGYKTVGKIRSFLNEYGLSFGMKEEDLAEYEKNTQEEEQVDRLIKALSELKDVLANYPDTTKAMEEVLAKGCDRLDDSEKRIRELIPRLNTAKEAFYVERIAYENNRLRQEKELHEQRRYEIAKKIYLKEKGCFLSGWQRACRAVHKADLLLEALKEE